MTQPPQDPAPGEQPWQDPSGAGSSPDPYGGQQQPPSMHKPQPDPAGGGQPPPYQGYGQPGQQGYGQQPYGAGGLPGYAGAPGGYVDPAAGLASRWARLFAAIIDSILLAIVIGLVTLPFVDYGRIFENSDGETTWVPTGQWTANITGVVLALLYYWLMHAKWGQTLGKKALGIRVVRAEDGGAIANGQALGRAAFYTVLGGICGCIGLIDVLWCLWDERKQCLHDKVAKTLVMKVEPGEPDPYAMR